MALLSDGVWRVLDAAVFWLLVVALGVAGLPLAELLFGRLPSRGLVFARPLGLLVAAFPIWLLASLQLVHLEQHVGHFGVGLACA